MSSLKRKFYITTPIYYVNDKPHIGHAYTTIAADVLARYYRSKKHEVFFLTGTDEHGANIELKAKEAGKEPQAFVDEIAGLFQKAWQELNISHDRFIRTTEADHIKAVQKALQVMYDKGDIYLGKYEGLYCPKCEQYKSERDLVDGKCRDHNIVPEKMSEECYMFKLSKYAKPLWKKIEKDEFKIRPLPRKNEIVSFYKNEGLQDVSFSRKNVRWGIPMPWDKSHTTYVWADAFLNYLTGLGWQGEAGKYPKLWPADVQLMSKDILRVHATIWPAMLLSLEIPLPKELFIHGYFLIDGQKMSKSIGNVIAPSDLVKKYGVDATRYLLMSATKFGSDGDIGWQKFDEKYNADLANNLGNLVSRVLNMIEKYCDGKIPKVVKSPKKLDKVGKHMEALAFDQALKEIWQAIVWANVYIDQSEPWKLAKEGKQEVLDKILSELAALLGDLAKAIEPFMPETSARIIGSLTSVKITKGEPLFKRI